MAMAWGYRDIDQTIRRHIYNEDKGTVVLTFSEGILKITIVNESSLDSLVLFGKLLAAKRFKRWATSKILPSVRKYSGYVSG